MLEGLKDIATGIAKTTNGLNPMVDDRTETHEDMGATLLDAGFTAKNLMSLVDVDRAQFEEWLDIEVARRNSKQSEEARNKRAEARKKAVA